MQKILIILGLIVSACIIAASCGKDEPTSKDSNFRFEYNITANPVTNFDKEEVPFSIGSLKTGLDNLTILNDKDQIITQAEKLIQGITNLHGSAISGTITLYQGSKKIKTWTL